MQEVPAPEELSGDLTITEDSHGDIFIGGLKLDRKTRDEIKIQARLEKLNEDQKAELDWWLNHAFEKPVDWEKESVIGKEALLDRAQTGNKRNWDKLPPMTPEQIDKTRRELFGP